MTSSAAAGSRESEGPGTKPTPVGRLAPSPTGFLHLGHARSFLLAWWHVRSRGGRIVLRIEDLDGPRVEERFIEAVLVDLEWLGIDWDGAPVRQSSHGERHQRALDELMEKGLLYACTCSRLDVQNALSAPQRGAPDPCYPGTCRDRYATLEEAAATGKPVGLRFRVPMGPITLDDGFMGPRAFDVASDVGDFLVARRGGTLAYQLAVVVDDAEQGVTEVLRGHDLLSSAARQWHLQNALGLPHPSWYHVPLVVDESGRRLAKRARDLGLCELRARGVDPRAIVAWAARSSGFAFGERCTPRDVLAEFDLARVPKTEIPIDEQMILQLQAARL